MASHLLHLLVSDFRVRVRTRPLVICLRNFFVKKKSFANRRASSGTPTEDPDRNRCGVIKKMGGGLFDSYSMARFHGIILENDGRRPEGLLGIY